MNPVLYEDKETKQKRREELQQRKKLNKSGYIDELRKEMYDLPEELHMGISNKKSKFQHD